MIHVKLLKCERNDEFGMWNESRGNLFVNQFWVFYIFLHYKALSYLLFYWMKTAICTIFIIFHFNVLYLCNDHRLSFTKTFQRRANPIKIWTFKMHNMMVITILSYVTNYFFVFSINGTISITITCTDKHIASMITLKIELTENTVFKCQILYGSQHI